MGAGFQTTLSGFYRQGRDLIDWIWMEDEKWHTKNLTEIELFIQKNPHIREIQQPFKYAIP